MYQYTNYFNILIGGRSIIDEYQHQGKIYVEGRKGSDYELRFQNSSGTRKKVVFSVDGLNILTGDKNWTKGYVVDPWQTVVIPGWRKDGSNVAKFMFSSVEGSYNQHNDSGDKNNVGVIGAMVFEEVPKPLPVYTTRSILSDNGIYAGSLGIGSVQCSTTNYTAQNSVIGTEMNREAQLGTGWGNTQSFQTTEVHYDFKSAPQAIMAIYYDSRTNLQRRGINLKEVVYTPPEPQAFPGYPMGCPTPK